jgi:signal transduction histidine kinase
LSDRPEYNLQILRPLATFVRSELGEQALRAIARAGEVEPEQIGARGHWVGLDRFEALLAEARAQLPDDETFIRACTRDLAAAYGPMRYVMWATSPAAVYAAAGRTTRLVTTHGEVEILSHGRNSVRARLTRPTKVSRLLCLVQQAQTAALPTLWGLPAAHLEEEACCARGDADCIYQLRFYDAKRHLPPVLGLATFGALAAALMGAHRLDPLGAGALALLGLTLGYVFELRRTERANLRVGEEINAALKALATEEGEVRREILELHRRQRDWSRMLEEQTNEHAEAFEKLLARIRATQQERESTLRGFSHDLKNPLTVLQSASEQLRESQLGSEVDEILDDNDAAIRRMTGLLDELVRVATSRIQKHQLTAQAMVVGEVTDALRRRLRALVHGRDIKASVFKTREAPETIRTDVQVFDRVIDNLLTNAAKYTERGSIVVELDGTPESLVIKISDTGRGIAPEELERTFRPGGSDASTRAAGSHGLGLSVAVSLLAQVGGRMEVMSKPGSGTTFWVHFPLELPPPGEPANDASSERRQETYDATLGRVLTIRRVKSA